MIEHCEVRPRPVYCVIDDQYRDLAVAQEVRSGRFTHLGVTVQLGVEPDWLGADLPEDEEWRIVLSKFYYGLDLASAFRETGDIDFLHTWERLVRSWIRHVPVGSDSSDVAGRRIQNWIYAWNRLVDIPGFSLEALAPGLTDEILASLSDQVHYLLGHLTPERNHRTLELYALFIAALALPQLDTDTRILDFAITELHCNLLTDILPDGTHRECSTHYHMIALRSFVGARENARRFGLHFDDEFDRHLAFACEFALHCYRPDGMLPALSDSDTDNYAGLLELAADILGRTDLLYGATAGARGIPPAQRYASFPAGGYFIQRSGWGEGETLLRDERFLIFDCGRLGDGSHGHYDLLSFECSANGSPLVIDPGRYTYSELAPNWRRWFKSTAAHNTVCVDGLDQTPYRRGKPRGPVAEGRLRVRLSAPGLDLLCGEATSPSYEVIHTRWIAFIADEYWIVVDRLCGNLPHHYDLRFHLAPAAWQQTTMEPGEDTVAVRSPGLALVFGSTRSPRIEPGWFAPAYGMKVPAPIVSIVAPDAVTADFVTLVVPLRPNDPVPGLRSLAGPSTGSQAQILEVSGVGPDTGYIDRVAWSMSPQHFDLGAVQCYASAAWLRESTAGERISFRACDVHEVMWEPHATIERPPDASHAKWDAGSRSSGIAWNIRRDR